MTVHVFFQLYKKLNIRVVLTGVVVWNSANLITNTMVISDYLKSFSQWAYDSPLSLIFKNDAMHVIR
jgi:hypothetical protein